MDSSTETVTKSTNSFISKVMDFDDETKTNMINGVQYISTAIIPIALLNMLKTHLFTVDDPKSKGTIELLAEVLGQVIVTLILILFIHKIIISIPTYSGAPYPRMNYSTLALGYLVSAFSQDQCGILTKFRTIIERLNESWSGKKTETNNKIDNKNKVSVSKPISGVGHSIPTHQVSRADYVNTHNQVSPPQETPPILPQQAPSPPPVMGEGGDNNIYGGPENNLVNAEFPVQEPMAANSVLGGGGFGTF